MKAKHIDIPDDKVPELLDVDAETIGPKIGKTYRINEGIFDEAEKRCKLQHDCGIATIIEPLLRKYFNL